MARLGEADTLGDAHRQGRSGLAASGRGPSIYTQASPGSLSYTQPASDGCGTRSRSRRFTLLISWPRLIQRIHRLAPTLQLACNEETARTRLVLERTRHGCH